MQQNDHEVVEATIVEAPKKRGFQPGHARMGGRKAGLPTKRQLFDEVCTKHKFSAVEFVVQCVKNGATPATADKPSLPISQSDRCRMGGLDSRECCQKLGIIKAEYFSRLYRLEAKLGFAFATLQPYSLVPREYFGLRLPGGVKPEQCTAAGWLTAG